MLRAWVCSSLCQERAVWSSGGTGVGSQGGGEWGLGVTRRRSFHAEASKCEASREGGLPHRAETSEEHWGTKIHAPAPSLYIGNLCPHCLTSHPGPPWVGLGGGQPQALPIHSVSKPITDQLKLCHLAQVLHHHGQTQGQLGRLSLYQSLALITLPTHPIQHLLESLQCTMV